MIQALHREALQGISEFAGNWRPAGVAIEGSQHEPVAAHIVPEKIEELCDYLNDHMTDRSAVHLSAYAMWKLNWIHPFSDGNGRTSRIFSYVVLSVKFGYVLPGTKTVPDQIVSNRSPYFKALESADLSLKEGQIDVSEMETFLERLLVNQLTSGFDRFPAIDAALRARRTAEISLEPRPAPFDFHVVDEVIDVAPESAISLDPDSTQDLAKEVLRKARAFHAQVHRANIDRSVLSEIDVLINRLENTPIRPGLILSSLRSLEATESAYDSEDGREQLSPYALKLIFDLCTTLRDLAATFPRSREIEAEAVSLQLPLDKIDEIRFLAADIVSQIESSDAATQAAKDALRETSLGIDNAQTLAQQAKQFSYHILDIDNFTRAGLRHLRGGGKAIAREAGSLGADTYASFRKDFAERAGKAASIAAISGVSGLLYHIGFDISGLATLISALLPLKKSIEGAVVDSADGREGSGTSSSI